MPLSSKQQELCTSSTVDYSDLKAVLMNCTLKRSPERSHTDGLMDVAASILEANRVSVDRIRIADHVIPPGVQIDMTQHGFDRDDWPELFKRVEAADILVLGTPIWLGEESSVCRLAIERLYGMLEIHSDSQADVRAAGQAILDALGLREGERRKPKE